VRVPSGKQALEIVKDGVRVTGWPKPQRSFDPSLGIGGFVFNGQTVKIEGGYLGTMYGYFEADKRYSLVAVESADGKTWKVRAILAGPECKLKGDEGPCEAGLARLKDGRILCVYRLHSGLPFGEQFSSDDGKTWTEPAAMDGPFSVQPSLAVMKDGAIALSGGRPGIFCWLNLAGDAKSWQKVDLQTHHNEFQKEQILGNRPNTSAYTEVVALDENNLLVIYDRVPNGWSAIPEGSADTNSVWVVRLNLERK
jgi:hypothetical protein